VLAAALAAAGMFKEATETATAAVMEAGPSEKGAIAGRLELYKANTHYVRK
jgi:hypothetical protein